MTFAERLVRLVAGPHQAAALVGDLEEEAARVGRGPGWIRGQLLRCFLSALGLCLRRSKARMFTTLRIAVRDASRSIRRTPVVSSVAVAILTLSIAAGAVTFAVVDTVLRPLPYAEPDRLVAVFGATPTDPRSHIVAYADYHAWREGARSFETLTAWRPWPMQLTGDAGPQDVTMVFATPNLFELLRVQPVLGAAFTGEHQTGGGGNVAVISHALWQQRFGGTPAVLGQTLRTATGPVTIIGVMPRGFAFPADSAAPPAIWRPLVVKPEEQALTDGRVSYLRVTGRLRDGATVRQARAEVEQISRAIAAAHPQLYTEWRPRVERMLDAITEEVGDWMRLVLAAVAALIAIACANVSNLLLTRSPQRTRDVSIRTSLGATRPQIVTSLLMESVILAVIAVAGGLLGAFWLLGAVKAMLPAGIPRAEAIALDARVLLACAAACVATAVATGLVPSWQNSRSSLAAIIKERAGSTGATERRWQQVFLVGQVALVTTLLIATTLVVGSLVRVLRVELGFARQNLVGVRLAPALPNGPDAEARARALYAQVVDAVRAVPGVTSVATLAGAQLPLWPTMMSTSLTTADSSSAPVTVDVRRISSDYIETAGIRLLEGRTFVAEDRRQPVAIIDEIAAGHLFGGQPAVGQAVQMPNVGAIRVVGVAANVRLLGPEGARQAQIYRPIDDEPANRVLVIRTAAEASSVAPAIEAAIAPLMPKGSRRVRADVVDERYRQLTADRRFNAALMSALGLLAFVIGVGGIYATTASLVAQRTREIGIRMALGATGSRVASSITSSAARLLVTGVGIGIALAWMVSGLMRAILFGVDASAAVEFAIPAVAIVLGGCLMAWLPASKAARVDPLTALRSE